MMIFRMTIPWIALFGAMSLLPQQAFPATLEMMVPLYRYPSWYNEGLPNSDPNAYIWDDIATANSRVPITAIINPNNGPGGGPPNEDYVVGLHHLREAGVKILGYVRTNFANRDGLAPLSQVYNDIRLYHDYFNVDGIFLDEAASGYPTTGVDENAIANYYQPVYDYIHALTQPSFKTVVVNPGTQTHDAYFSTPATDTSVIFESYQGWETYVPDPYVKQLRRKNFAMLLYDMNGAEDMNHAIDLAVQRNIGYVYVTSCGPSQPSCPNPWSGLPSYWEQELAHIEEINAACRRSYRADHEHGDNRPSQGLKEWPDSNRRHGQPHEKCSVSNDPREGHHRH